MEMNGVSKYTIHKLINGYCYRYLRTYKDKVIEPCIQHGKQRGLVKRGRKKKV